MSNLELNSEQVEAYLQKNPDFFKDHLKLLTTLTIPHPSGSAVSLISKQLELFRHRHYDLENQLTSLLDIALENETLLNRMHELTLVILEANTILEALDSLEQVLRECFLVDFVQISIIQKTPVLVDERIISPKDEALSMFRELLIEPLPFCGKLSSAQKRYLFGVNAFEVQSCAFIPLMYVELEGMIVMGSREEQRFHADLETTFLIQMAEIFSTQMVSLLRQVK